MLATIIGRGALWRAASALVVVIAFALPAAAGSPTDVGSLAAELARLRGEVEGLSTQIETRKVDQRARMRSLAAQRADFEIQLKREQTRLKELQQRQVEQQGIVERRARRMERLAPEVGHIAVLLGQTIDEGLPFKRADRRAEVRRVVERMRAGLLTPDAAIARLWERAADELRLSRESGLYRQVIVLEGREQLAEVARLGMVLLYFCTEDGRCGAAVREGEGWAYRLLPHRDDQAAVRSLFEAFRKQIRTGLFELPNALPVEGEQVAP
jgi:hypothetical protein